MADVTLSDGKEVTFDLYRFTVDELDKFRARDAPRAEEMALLSKASGLSVEEFKGMAYPDYFHVIKAFVERCNDPLAEPN